MKFRVFTDKANHDVTASKLITNETGQLVLIDDKGTVAAFAMGKWNAVLLIDRTTS